MLDRRNSATRFSVMAATVATSAVTLLALGLGAGTVQAQDAAATKANAKWVKLCENVPVLARDDKGKAQVDAEGKPMSTPKRMCLTQHEAIDGRTGIPLVTAALRTVEGEDKKTFLVGMPLGMNIPTGIRVAFHSASEWEKISKDGKFANPDSVKWTKLSFVHCLETNCIAEGEATPELVKGLEANAVMTAAAVNFRGGPVALPVPLTGFTAANNGEPVDSKQYAQARQQMVAKIRERQRAAIAAFRKTAAEKAAAEKAGETKKN
ncbi:MAG: invasion associated locus B family protein [Pseudomonadota bacterium]